MCSSFPLTCTNNYVDPLTGAHTQTIKGLWTMQKNSNIYQHFGMRPKDLQYRGSFMWIRFCKQRKLDTLMHMLKCISKEVLPSQNVLPVRKLKITTMGVMILSTQYSFLKFPLVYISTTKRCIVKVVVCYTSFFFFFN